MTDPSLADKVYNELKDRLLRNDLVPGEMLNRRTVAREMGVSAMPVLEAMVRLEADGLLETLPRRGTRVRLVRPRDLRGELIVREALECQAARQYCGPTVRAQRKRLTALAREADRGVRGDTPDPWKREIDFHRSLLELADCPALLTAFHLVMNKGLFMATNTLIRPHLARGSLTHARLVKALQVEDPDQAERDMRAHLRAGKGELLRDVR